MGSRPGAGGTKYKQPLQSLASAYDLIKKMVVVRCLEVKKYIFRSFHMSNMEEGRGIPIYSFVVYRLLLRVIFSDSRRVRVQTLWPSIFYLYTTSNEIFLWQFTTMTRAVFIQILISPHLYNNVCH
jgi:hypothetical protein